ncbi:MAG TPA: AAA family ATPase [Candidatus Limnocylindrales bacterium]|nr:AAA family ATPase [Candidatus Limnocylindrales bacterium]
MGRTIACANQKGGVGKTTTVVNLGAYLSLAGRRVLVLDLDPQGNATSGLGIDRTQLERSTYDVLLGDTPLGDVVVSTGLERLSLAPSTIALAGADVELAAESGRERRLLRSLRPFVAAYDDVLIDCPPSLGLLTVNALTAADAVLVPVQCEYYALEGLGQLIGTIDLVRDHLNPTLSIEGAVLTMFDARTNLAAQVVDEVRRNLGPAVYRTVIPRSVRLSEAPSYGQPIATYRPDSKGAAAYDTFAREYLERSGSAVRDGAILDPVRSDVPAASGIGEIGFANRPDAARMPQLAGVER